MIDGWRESSTMSSRIVGCIKAVFTPIAGINAQGGIVARYVYGSRDHVPEYIFTATAIYRLIVDQLGSVRLAK